MRVRPEEAANLFCPFARNSDQYLIAGTIPTPVVVNRNIDGSTAKGCFCLAHMCMMWRSDNDGATGFCGAAGVPQD